VVAIKNPMCAFRCVSRLLLRLLFPLSVAAAAGSAGGESGTPEDWQRRLEMLRSVPYLSASESIVDETTVGVQVHDDQKSCQGYNFYCTLFTGEAFLMDMDGRIVHRWSYPHHRRERGTDHALFLSNGDVVILKEYRELVRLDWNSRLLWRRSLQAHHDMAQAEDGTLYVILRAVRSYRGFRVTFPSIAHLTADGEVIDRWSAFDRLEELKKTLDTRSFLDTILDGASDGGQIRPPVPRIRAPVPGSERKRYEYFHMNAITVLDGRQRAGRDPLWSGGNLLVCFRNVNQIAVLERSTYRVLWAWGEGELEWPHHPTLLENGHILVFDNGVHRGYSRILELDPVTERIVWEYRSEPPEDFFSHSRGAAQRLDNGNTLITESDRGRVFEVTPKGEIVWRWQNPALIEPLWQSLDSARAGRGGARRSEALYRMIRLPADRVKPLLDRWWWAEPDT